MRVQRRARDRDGTELKPMSLANMRQNGARSVKSSAAPAITKRRSMLITWTAQFLSRMSLS
jgi:hypothetical protein